MPATQKKLPQEGFQTWPLCTWSMRTRDCPVDVRPDAPPVGETAFLLRLPFAVAFGLALRLFYYREAVVQFMETKRLWGKLGGRMCYHGYQSFKADVAFGLALRLFYYREAVLPAEPVRYLPHPGVIGGGIVEFVLSSERNRHPSKGCLFCCGRM